MPRRPASNSWQRRYFAALASLAQGDGGAFDTIERIEARSIVKDSWIGRTLDRVGDPWLLRLVIGRALGPDETYSKPFTLDQAIAIVGDRVRPRHALLSAITSTGLCSGLIPPNEDRQLAPALGLVSWFLSGELPWPALEASPVYEGSPRLDSAARIAAQALGRSFVAIARCQDPAFVLEFASRVASSANETARGHAVSGFDDRDPDPLPTILASARLWGTHTVVMPLGLDCQSPWGASRVGRCPPMEGARLWFVLTAEADEAPPTLPGTVEVDLEPLRQEVLAEKGHRLPDGLKLGEMGPQSLRHLSPSLGLSMGIYGAPSRRPSKAHERRRRQQEDSDEVTATPAGCTLEDVVLDATTLHTLTSFATRTAARQRGVLVLTGPPGTGKSLIARAVAGSAGRPVLALDSGQARGALYGAMERHIARLFDQVNERQAILVVDDADQWLRSREIFTTNEHPERECTLMLQGLSRCQGTVVLTTSHPERLDSGLRARADTWVSLPAPGPVERCALWSRAMGEATLDPATWAVLMALPLTGGDITAIVAEVGEAGPREIVAAARRRLEARAAGV